MKVKAKFKTEEEYGFYGGRLRFNGDVFDIDESAHFSTIWMEKIDDEAKRGRKPKVETELEDGGE